MRYLHPSLFATLGVCSLASCFSSTSSPPPVGMDASSAGDVGAPGEDAPDRELDASRRDDTDATIPNEASAPVDAGVEASPEAATEAGPVEASVPEAGPLCGNGVIDPGETCDGALLGGATCNSTAKPSGGGTLACAANCLSYNVSACLCAGTLSLCQTGTPACVDLANDPKNCGTCGNTCDASSACTSSHCTTVLHASLGTPIGIAIDATSIYYANDYDGKIYSMPLAGGAPTNLTTSGNGTSAWEILVSGSTLYWTTYVDDRVFKVPTTGGAAVVVSPTDGSPEGIVSDGTYLYWADSYSSSPLVRRASIATGTLSTVESPPDGGTNPFNPITIAVDATNVYWGNAGTSLGTSSVYQANKTDGSNPIALATGVDPVYGLTIDSTNVYFTAGLAGSVYSVPIGGGTVKLLAGTESNPSAIVADGTSLYWLATSTVRKMAKTGGAITTLATCNGNLAALSPYCGDFRFLVLDANYVYWTDSGTQSGYGAVFRVSKN
jgi:sugar lactone lactonase YvrE